MWFTRDRIALLAGLAFAGLVFVLLVLRPAPEPADPCDAACVAQGQASKHHRETADSLARVAAVQETVYVARKQKAAAAVAAIPPVEIEGDTIVLAVGRFLVAHPVAVVITTQRAAITDLTATVQAGDSVIATQRLVIAEKDRALVAADSAHAIERRNWQASQPSRLSRLWNDVKAPLAFVGGIALGIKLGQGVR